MRTRWCSLLALLTVASACGQEGSDGVDPAGRQGSITNGFLAQNVDPYRSALWLGLPNGECSAAKIGLSRIITAAHCLTAVQPGSTIQVANAAGRAPTFTFTVLNKWIHPTYENIPDGNLAYDIGLIDVLEDASFLPFMALDTTYVGDASQLAALGYGCDNNNPSHTDFKQVANIGTVSLATLQGAGLSGIDTQSVYTINSPSVGASGAVYCYGDSGGPTIRFVNGSWMVSGIHVFTFQGFPYNFDARLGDIYLWINSPLKNEFVNSFGGSFLDNNSGKCMGVQGDSLLSNANVNQYYCDGRQQAASSQYWSLIDRGGGYFSLKNGNSGLCLGIDGNSKGNGARATPFPCDGRVSQSWRFVASPVSGYYTVINRNSNQCLAVNQGSKANGAQIFQWPCNGNPDQRWVFVE